MTRYTPLITAALGLLLLPPLMLSIGLTMTSAAEVVIFAIACLALNVLTGHTGLVSFGHGAWFGMAAYAAGIAQRELFPEGFFGPVLIGLGITALAATVFGFLILRRRGVYFSLLTLALSAMLYVIAFRWTGVTGGENGLGGITRPAFAGASFEDPEAYYYLVGGIGFAVVFLLWRLHGSPLGSVLVAIRENEQRARFLGYRTDRYKLAAFVISATLTGLAGVLLLYKNRMTSAEPISVIFSGELLAMVVIGGMRSFIGPMIGALFYVLFREFLSIYTPNWLFWFGLLFVGFIVFSPDGLAGIGRRLLRLVRPDPVEDAAMSGRRVAERPFPAHLRPGSGLEGPALEAENVAKSFGALKAVDGVSLQVADRSLHALIGPNGAGKTTAFNLMSGMFAPDRGTVKVAGRRLPGGSPEAAAEAGIGRSFQITNLFPELSVEENIRLAAQAQDPARFDPWRSTRSLATTRAETREMLDWLGLAGMERAPAGSLSYGGQRLLDLGLALAARPRILLLDEPLAGLAAAERARVGDLIKTISQEIPVLLVEHDIDRVFQLADHVTVMNEGVKLLDGDAETVRGSAVVQEVYIGAGNAAIAARPRASAATSELLLRVSGLNTHYGKSHILADLGFELRQNEIMALLGRNGAGKSTLLKSLIGIAPVSSGSIELGGVDIARWSSAEMARAGIGYAPQGRGLFAGMTVRQNLELGRLRRRTGQGAHWDEERIFTFFPRIRERLETPADMLSGGEQQMVAVARALSGDTRLLLLDEPFEGLAPTVVEQLFESFDRLRQEVSIIIVDHNLDLALALSDRTVALERGRVIHEGASAALRDDLDLRRQVLWL
ncbi:branched-chain amino acid ABC transporter ATP-binding protein/permease [Paralimibaculum aggregatum]|nr:branched-chain amino acid ABC transporter ATP-binding protein/permease [Limibaculum sp. NKW23]